MVFHGVWRKLSVFIQIAIKPYQKLTQFLSLIKLQNREVVIPKVLKKPGEKPILKQNFNKKKKHKDHRRTSNKQ